MTICPCCGFKFHGALSRGCQQCGARPVGEPLPKPEHVLPSYGRSLALTVTGSLVALVFIIQTIVAFFQLGSDSYGFWTWVAAGETAAWRLKWVSIPVLLVVFWFGGKLYRSILNRPEKFCGAQYARGGLIASATIGMLIALLIGVTVPARLEHRRQAAEAAERAPAFRIAAAQTEYMIKYQTYPADTNALLERLPDTDGSLAAAIKDLAPGAYRPSADVAAVAAEKSPRLRGAVIRKTSLSSATDDTPPGGISFTNYVLRMPGADKITGTDDDWVVRDGMVMKLSEVAKGGVGSSVSAGALQP